MKCTSLIILLFYVNNIFTKDFNKNNSSDNTLLSLNNNKFKIVHSAADYDIKYKCCMKYKDDEHIYNLCLNDFNYINDTKSIYIGECCTKTYFRGECEFIISNKYLIWYPRNDTIYNLYVNSYNLLSDDYKNYVKTLP